MEIIIIINNNNHTVDINESNTLTANAVPQANG